MTKYAVLVGADLAIVGPYTVQNTADSRAAEIRAAGNSARVFPMIGDAAYFGKPVGNRRHGFGPHQRRARLAAMEPRGLASMDVPPPHPAQPGGQQPADYDD